MPQRPKVIAFDIIGTVFSLEPLRRKLTELGLPPHALELWFAETLRDAFALAATGTFAPFASIFESTLANVAARHSIRIDPEQKKQVIAAFGKLPAHGDASETFRSLRAAGFRIFALNNGAAASTSDLLKNAGLTDETERVISVEEVKAFKPRSEVYLHAAKTGRARVGRHSCLGRARREKGRAFFGLRRTRSKLPADDDGPGHCRRVPVRRCPTFDGLSSLRSVRVASLASGQMEVRIDPEFFSNPSGAAIVALLGYQAFGRSLEIASSVVQRASAM